MVIRTLEQGDLISRQLEKTFIYILLLACFTLIFAYLLSIIGEVPEPVCSVKDPRRGEMAVCAIITTGRFYGATYDQAGRA